MHNCIWGEWAQEMHGLYPDDSKFLIKSMQNALEEINNCCTDNFRFYLVGDKTQQQKYEGATNNGCCGFYDKKVIHPKSKNIYWIGFNYGH